ncbi:MAG: hypothetical protein KBG28_05555 [Kofleriaceae bacterium]|jgi:hypothetical protein|nr:hypothetical protein [Kofleriaceae bacterium]MBP6837443.1 hypothetical protein [Kofleriaceae bacterium]MBP9203410.1 hypothetical protein [Kofleriaceae bacterium]
MWCLVTVTALLCGAGGCMRDHGAAPTTEVKQDDCYTCHVADYEGATMPPHVGIRPTTCAGCHWSTDDWHDAFDGIHPEDKFPIARGKHAMPCLDCHRPDLLGENWSGGANVSCIDCHSGEHSMARMNDKHNEERDYRWQPNRPAFCLECHPRGRD